MRSKWKLNCFVYNLPRRWKRRKVILHYFKRTTILTSMFLDKRVKVSNGKTNIILRPKEKMLGLKMGEIIPTKVLGIFYSIKEKKSIYLR